jgi:integrase
VIHCTSEGTCWGDANVRRSWERVRRRARADGIRPFKLHAARHTWASLALQSGKSVKWTADQLGHSDPALTLRTYAHAIVETEARNPSGFLVPPAGRDAESDGFVTRVRAGSSDP